MIDYLADGVVQTVPYTSQLVVPSVPLVAIGIHYEPPDQYTVHKYPVISLRQTIYERWAKERPELEGGEEIEPAYSTPGEFEEAGYKFWGRNAEVEYLFVNQHGAVEASEGFSLQHFHEEQDPDKPILRAGCLRVCYGKDTKSIIADLKKEVREYFERLLEFGCDEGDENEDDDL